MSKKCTPLWREAHLEVKMYKAHHVRTTRRRKSAHRCELWGEAHFEVKMLKTPGVRTTFGGSDVASLRFTTLHYITLHYTPLHYTTLYYTTLPSTTLHYITLHYTPLQLQLQRHNYTPLH